MSSVETSVKVVRPSAALTAATAAAFREDVLMAIAADTSGEVTIDMSHVDSVDNSGLAAILAGYNAAKRHHKRLSMCGVAPAVRIVFELAQLDRAVSVVDRQGLQAA